MELDMFSSTSRTRGESIETVEEFLDRVNHYECGLSILFRVPFLYDHEAQNLLSRASDDFNPTLRNYLLVCASENRLGLFPEYGIRVTGVMDRNNGQLNSALKELDNVTIVDDRLVSAKITTIQGGPHGILKSVLGAYMQWSERLWDAEKPNDWVDHFQAESVHLEIWRTRGLPPNASPQDKDRYGIMKSDLMWSPRTVSVSFDLQQAKFKESLGSTDLSYSNEEIMANYPYAAGGLSPAYETNPSGVLSMLRDFESEEFGETPDLSGEDGLVVCLSQHWYAAGSTASSSTQNSGDSSQARYSRKMLEQLSFFILHMGRLYGTVRIWWDFILKKRNIRTDPWEKVGLVPYMIWPTVYVSSQVGTPEQESYNRIWGKIEQFCYTYGRGAFMFSFDLASYDEENPSARHVEQNSILATTNGIVQGRYGGVDETIYLFIRAFKYGVFQKCSLGSWKSHFEGNLMRWAEREELRIIESGSVPGGPFIFSDSLANEKPPSTTLIAAVFDDTSLSGGFEGLKSLLPPSFDYTISDEAFNDETFEWAKVYPYRMETEEDKDLTTTRTEYFVLTRPDSGYGNCWICAVSFGPEMHPMGHVSKIVHYVSSNGKRYPKSGIRSAEEEQVIREAGGFLEWFSEALDVIKTMTENSSRIEWMLPLRRSMLETTTGLPSWDGYGVS